jgi:hypothetical protein
VVADAASAVSKSRKKNRPLAMFDPRRRQIRSIFSAPNRCASKVDYLTTIRQARTLVKPVVNDDTAMIRGLMAVVSRDPPEAVTCIGAYAWVPRGGSPCAFLQSFR